MFVSNLIIVRLIILIINSLLMIMLISSKLLPDLTDHVNNH